MQYDNSKLSEYQMMLLAVGWIERSDLPDEALSDDELEYRDYVNRFHNASRDEDLMSFADWQAAKHELSSLIKDYDALTSNQEYSYLTPSDARKKLMIAHLISEKEYWLVF